MPAKAKVLKTPRVSDLLKKQLNRAPIPDLGLVAAEFIDRAGGPRNFGTLLWEEWTKAAAGSMARQRIIELVGRFIKGSEAKLSADDMDGMSDVELQALLVHAAKQAGVIRDEPAAGPPAQEEPPRPGGSQEGIAAGGRDQPAGGDRGPAGAGAVG